jgi:hypothetical protein
MLSVRQFEAVNSVATLSMGAASWTLSFFLRGTPWARTAVIILMLAEIGYMVEEYPWLIINFPYIIIGGVIVYYMYRPHAKGYFRDVSSKMTTNFST